MDAIQDIVAYIQQYTRNRIVFCRDYIGGVDFLDVGYELSLLAGDHPEEISSYETKLRQVLGRSSQNETIGCYLAIDDIGILFEPELKFDVRSIFDSYSKNQCLIIKSDGIIQNDVFFFLSPEDSSKVNLAGLSYKLI